MIKVNLINRQNLTLLAKAFMDDLLPQGKKGQVFYEEGYGIVDNETDEVVWTGGYIYFKNEEYFKELLEFIAQNRHKFSNSNNSKDWNLLFETISDYEKITEIDYSKCEFYSLTVEDKSNPREISTEVIEKGTISSSIFIDMKKVFCGYNVTYWGDKNNIIIHLPDNPKYEFNFSFNIIFELIKLHKLKLKDIQMYKVKNRGINVLKILIEPNA